MANSPVIHVAISLTSPTFRSSDADETKPSIIVETTLITPSVITVNARGERDAGTILGSPKELEFRVEIFAFHDVSTSEPVVHDLFPGSCEPGELLVELHASKPRVTRAQLHEIDPLSDPINILKPGHAYRVMLKPQRITWWTGGIDELLARSTIVAPSEGPDEEEAPDFTEYKYPDGSELMLACDDELILKVEE